MVLASGANWGLARTLPHILGIAVGFPVMIVAVGFGLDAAFEAFPQLYEILKWVAFAYLLYLAWRVANAGRPKLEEEGGRPLSLPRRRGFPVGQPQGLGDHHQRGRALHVTGRQSSPRSRPRSRSSSAWSASRTASSGPSSARPSPASSTTTVTAASSTSSWRCCLSPRWCRPCSSSRRKTLKSVTRLSFESARCGATLTPHGGAGA